MLSLPPVSVLCGHAVTSQANDMVVNAMIVLNAKARFSEHPSPSSQSPFAKQVGLACACRPVRRELTGAELA